MSTAQACPATARIDYGFGLREPESLNELVALRAQQDGAARYITFLADADRDARAMSFAELERGSLQVAGVLAGRGLRPGERILLILPSGLDFVRAFFGILAAGMVPVPAYPPARMARLEHYLRTLAGIVNAASCAAGIVDRRLLPLVEGRLGGLPLLDERELDGAAPAPAAAELEPSSPAFLQFTSGTTARPRGVLLHQAHVLAQLKSYAETTAQAPGKVAVSWLPLYHDLGLIGKLCACLYARMELVLLDPVDFLKDPLCWLRAISRHRATHTAAPNFAYGLAARKCSPEKLAAEQIDLASLEIMGIGGEPVSWRTIEAFRERFVPFGLRPEILCPCYGLAENTLGATGHRHGETTRRLDVSRSALEQGQIEPPSRPQDAWTLPSNGRAMPGMRLFIAGPEGRDLGPRAIGEVWIQGPSVAAGYFDDGEATRSTFVEREDGRWLRTGDLGFIDRGELYLCGRQKDMIIVRGRNYHPQDIEELAGQVAGVRAGCCAAFAIPADEGQERCVLACELDPRAGRSPEAVRQELESAICAAFELAVEVLALPHGAVPKTSSGKLQRGLLREAYLSGEMAGFAPPGALRRLALWLGMRLGRLRRAKRPLEGAAPAPAGEEPLEALDPRIVEAVRRALPSAREVRLSPRLRLDAIGLDSLARMELWLAVESLYQAHVPQDAWSWTQTLGDVQRLSESHAGTQTAACETNGQPLFVRKLLDAPAEPLPEPHRPPRSAPLAFGIVRLASRICWRRRVHGAERLPDGEGYLLAGNHSSYLDGAWLRDALPRADRRRLVALSWAALERKRAIAWFASLVETISIDPERSILAAMQGGLDALSRQRILLVFPEGERTYSGRIEPFRPGAGLLALLSGKPIVPFRIDGGFEIYPRHRVLPRFAGWRTPATRRLELSFGEPLHPPPHDPARTWDQARELVARLQAAVAAL